MQTGGQARRLRAVSAGPEARGEAESRRITQVVAKGAEFFMPVKEKTNRCI